MNELVISKENLVDIAYQDKLLSDYTSSIKGLINEVSKNYIFVGFWLCKVNKLDLKSLGYENISDYSEKVFNITKSTAYNMMGIAEKFCRWDGYYVNYPSLKDEFKGFNYGQLRELLTLDKIDVDRFRNKTVAEIQDLKIIDKVKQFINVNIEKHLDNLKKHYIPNLLKVPGIICENCDVLDDDLLFDNLIDYNNKVKCSESKLNYEVMAGIIRVSKIYSFTFKNDKDISFKLYYNIGFKKDETIVSTTLDFDCSNWSYRNKLKNLPGDIEIDLDKKLCENLDVILPEFKAFFNDYFKVKIQVDKQNKNSSDEAEKLKNAYEELKYVDSKVKDIKKHYYYKKVLKADLEALKEVIDLDIDNAIITIDGGYGYPHIYFKLKDNLYLWFSDSTTVKVYEKRTDAGNPKNIGMYLRKDLIKAMNNVILDAFENNKIDLKKGNDKNEKEN